MKQLQIKTVAFFQKLKAYAHIYEVMAEQSP